MLSKTHTVVRLSLATAEGDVLLQLAHAATHENLLSGEQPPGRATFVTTICLT